MRTWLATLVALSFAASLFGHVTPNVELVRKGEFLKQSLSRATQFFEKKIPSDGPDFVAIRDATGWAPSEENARLYVGRDAEGRLVGSVVFLWVPSQHGPLRVGVAFDADGTILRVAVTDVASEALACVRPVLAAGGMEAFVGLGVGASVDPDRVAPQVTGSMSRYYARLIAQSVARARALERAARLTVSGP